MIKKITVNQLKPGMYVHDIDAEWLEGHTLPNRMMIKSDADIMAIRNVGIREVYLDTEKGMDVADAPTAAEVEDALAAQMMALGDDDEPPVTEVKKKKAPLKPTTMEQELTQAAEVKKAARKLVGNVLEDARMGGQVRLGPVKLVVEQLVESTFRNQDALLSLSLLKQKDDYTFMHSVNVGVFLISFCRGMGLDEETIQEVGVGGLLHDIGKMHTPPDVLNKPGRLTDEEFDIMRGHVTHSKTILEQAPGISTEALQVAYQHHERFDGSGYPNKLEGDQINHFGQMAAIVDVYDAITSDRVYHKGMTPHVALKKMMEWSKYHFNPELFQSFVRCVGIYPSGTMVRLDDGMVGVVINNSPDSLLHPVVKVIIDAKTGRKVTPHDVDLMALRGTEGERTVVNTEKPEKWRVDPKQFMPQSQAFQ